MELAFYFLFLFPAVIAGAFPQRNLDHKDIDKLVTDYVKAYKAHWKSQEPLDSGSIPPFKINTDEAELQIQLVNTKVWIGDTDKYSEASSLSDSALSIMVDITQKDVKMFGDALLTGKVKGVPIDQKGTFELKWARNGLKVNQEYTLTPDSVTLTDFIFKNHYDRPTLKIEGIEIDGVKKVEVEQVVIDKLLEYFDIQQTQSRNMMSMLIASINEKLEGLNIQGVYEYLKNKLPTIFN